MSHIKSGIIGKMSLPSDQAGISLHTGNWTSDLGLVARPLSLSSSLTCCVQLGIKHTESLFYTLILCVPSSVCSARFSIMCLCSSGASVVSDSLHFYGLYPHQPPVSVGFSSQEYWNGLLSSPSEDLPDTQIDLGLLPFGQILHILASKEASDSPPHK